MALIQFPDPRRAAYEGIVVLGGQLNVPNLLNAYRRGIFPWPIEGWPLTWFCPEERAVLEFKDLHVAHSLRRARRRAHSVEVWAGDELVGGLYGVDAGGAFAGESMFHLRPNASKLALLFLIEHLRARGLDWLDIQVMTPHMEALGARLISRDEFLERLARTRRRGLKLF